MKTTKRVVPRARGRAAARRVTGQLLDGGDAPRASGRIVEAWPAEPGALAPLAVGRVAADGSFTLTLDSAAPAGRSIAVYAFDAKRSRLLAGLAAPLRLGRKRDASVVLRAGPVAPAPRRSAVLPELASHPEVRLAPAFSRFLQERKLTSVEALRRHGPLTADPALPRGAARDVVDVLDAHAALSLLPAEVYTKAALIQAGYRDVYAIARAPREDLARALGEGVDVDAVQVAAIDHAGLLTNRIIDARVRAASRDRSSLPQALQDALPQTCDCPDCRSATGPIAYLADLLDYTLRHLRRGGQPVTLTWLQDWLHQPLRDLPATCDEVGRKLRRVRLCVEILREHLGAQAPAADPRILESAYRELLASLGASFEELRETVRGGTVAERDALQARLGLPTAAAVDALLRDPNAPANDPRALTEAWLNEMAGLRATTLAPLAAAPEPQAQIAANMPTLLRAQRRALWDQWSAADFAATGATLAGRPLIDPDVIGLPDLRDVAANPVPRLQRPDRTRWSVLDFLEERQGWLITIRGELRASVPGPAASLPAQLTTLLQQLQSPATSFPGLPQTGLEGLTYDVLLQLYRKRRAGENIASAVQQLGLSAAEFDALARVVDLVDSNGAVLASEWDEFFSIVIGRVKRAGFSAQWKDEERQARVTIDREPPLTGITASPFHFQDRSASAAGAAAPWRPVRWRSTERDRAQWEELLGQRTQQLQNRADALQRAVEAAESGELPELRNLLLRTSVPPGVRLPAHIKALTDRYQIDFADGACAWTTRVAQATESLQGVLFGARNGLLDAPELNLDDDAFDARWSWLGSFATWSAAMQVILRPETVLRPALRTQSSPGFAAFISELRSLGKLTAASARGAVAVYERYFADVCSLEPGVCTVAPAPGLAGADSRNYLFARSGSGRLYGCWFDLNDEQSYWRQLVLPDLDEVAVPVQLFGACTFTRADGRCFLYFFGRQSGRSADRLIYGRTDLGRSTDWSELTWQTGVLEPLPTGASRFAFAQVLTNRAATDPIQLSVWLNARDAFLRPLDALGASWEGTRDFVQVPATGAWRRLGGGSARTGADFACSPAPVAPRSIIAGDFDRDGLDEIVIVPNRPGTEGNDLWCMKFNPATQAWSHLSPIPQHPFSADLDAGPGIDPPARFALSGDFDGDGFPELAIAIDLSAAGGTDNMDDTCFWARKFNPATGAWESLGSPPGPLPYGVSFGSKNDFFSIHVPRLTTRFAAVGDFDGDGRDEIAVAVSVVGYVDLPPKFNGCTFLFFDLELHASGAHVWRNLPDLQCVPKQSVDVTNARLPYSRFAVAGRFRPGDDRALLVVGQKLSNATGVDFDPNAGNDCWVCRFDGTGWQMLQPQLDCANLAVAAKFAVVGDFDGDSIPEIALAQEAILPGATAAGFWIGKMDLTGGWTLLPTLEYGPRAALFAVAGDFDGDRADELAIVTPQTGTANVQVFDYANGQWAPLQASGTALLASGGALGVARQPGQIPGDEPQVSATAARLLPAGSGRATQLVALAQPATDNTARAWALDTTITGGWAALCAEPEVKPAFPVASPILPTPEVARARQLNLQVPAALGARQRATNRAYLDEMLYFVPLEIAHRLRETGAYRDALDWCRLVYDFGAPAGQRRVAAKLSDGVAGSPAADAEWLQATLDPHAIAATRDGAYERYAVFLIARCLIDWADAEFSAATSESVPHARELYERALDLLNEPGMRPQTNECQELITWIRHTIGEDEALLPFEPVLRELAQLRGPAALGAASRAITEIMGTNAPLAKKVARALTAVRKAAPADDADGARSFGELRDEADRSAAALARWLMTDDRVATALTRGPLARRDRLDGVGAAGGTRAAARIRDEVSNEWPRYPRFIPAPVVALCIPPNPALTALRRHAELCLEKLRACRNIAGLELRLEPYGGAALEPAPADENALTSPAALDLQPLPYRYTTLIERTKQVIEIARQMESSMLQFISSADQARYQELNARHDLELNRAGVRLKDLQVVQATDSLGSAALQRDRAQTQVSHYTQLLGNGLTMNEEMQIGNLVSATVHQHATAIGAWIEAGFGIGSYSGAIGASGAAWALNSQFHGLMASFERRAEEWQLEKAIADQDLRAGMQQMRVGQDQLNVAREEQSIALLQANHAEAVVNFLAGRFLSADLYEWMADVLQQVYRFFLQQATQLARLAELQLAFERQEPPSGRIKADYWAKPADGMTPDVGASSSGTNSVRGLTGSARLLRDVYELDQYAFEKNRRKQQLSETFSLAELDPFAFQQFRQTGRLGFATPMRLFDRRFPGHYLRLIQRVRTSVVALIPPTMGIRATLSSVGTTRVTIGPEVFRTVTVQRGPQLVALTSPINATGLFDLDAQPELLVPFEGLGVDGQWVFELSKAANPFDFDAIADVLVTFDYTALYSPDYEQQVRRTLDHRFAADRAFGFRNEFADAWYDLNNPEIVDAPGVPMTVSFVTRRADFPPNLESLRIRQVLLQFLQTPAGRQPVPVTELFYTNGAGQPVPANPAQRAAVSDATGLISTRSGAWNALLGGAITGDLKWTLQLPETMKLRFKNQEVTDLFFVISYEAQTP